MRNSHSSAVLRPGMDTIEGRVEAEGDEEEWLMGSPRGTIVDVDRLTRLYSVVVAVQRVSPRRPARTVPRGVGTSCRVGARECGGG